MHPYQIFLQDQVLLVRTEKSHWGFPKGGEKWLEYSNPKHGPFETIFQNGAREFLEEVAVNLKRLIIIKNIYLVEQFTQTRYMIAVCLSPYPGEPDFRKMSWRPPCDDKKDNNPVTEAKWMSVDAFIDNEKLSMNVKKRNMPHSRLVILSKARWIMRGSILACGAFPNVYIPGALQPGVDPNPAFHSRCLP